MTYLYDDNHISLDGPTSWSFTEDVLRRYEAYGWQVLRVENGNTDLAGIDARDPHGRVAGRAADDHRRAHHDRLRLAPQGRHVGRPRQPARRGGSRADQEGSGLGVDGPVPHPEGSARSLPHGGRRAGPKKKRSGSAASQAYAKEYPDLAEEWRAERKGALPKGWDADLPKWKTGESLATRVAGGKSINAIAKHVPWLLGGDADLSESTKTKIEGQADFDGQTGAGNNIHYGVREHAMAAIANGMSYHGGVRPFVATFFCFSDYMRPSIRLAALNHLPTIFVWTHDSIGLGEDGPTHQAVEQLMSLRLMPHFSILRPGDANETAEAWRAAIEHRDGAVGMVLCRQNLPVLDRSGAKGDASRGAYILAEASGGEPRVILIGNRLGAASGRRGPPEARGGGGPDARGVDALLGVLRQAAPRLPRRGLSPGESARACRSRPASRSAGRSTSGIAADRSASIASAPRLRGRS